jgi:Cysteine rich repeat
MAERQSSSGIIAGAITIVGLGLVWVTVSANFPSQEELFSGEMPPETRRAPASSSPPSAPPMLDLTIPTSPSLSSDAAQSRLDKERPGDSRVDGPVVTRLDPSTLQATKLKCEAEIDQLCPDALDGPAHADCLDQRAKQLTVPCQGQLHERFVKWKEGRSQLIAACDEDIRQFCRAVKIGSGEILQCLQSHGQHVSDRCYQILPKGTVFFK